MLLDITKHITDLEGCQAAGMHEPKFSLTLVVVMNIKGRVDFYVQHTDSLFFLSFSAEQFDI